MISSSLSLLTSLAGCSTGDVIGGSVKEELGESRERPTDIRWMLGNAVCYTAGTQTHSGEVSVTQRLLGTATHTHMYADTLCSYNR